MSEAAGALLRTGIAQMGLPADAQRVAALEHLLAMLQKWNKTYNLTAIRDAEGIVQRHFFDSLAVLPYLHGASVIDIGTGAGFPGLPLAIYAPACRFTLLDSNGKKTRFVQQAVLELQLRNVTVRQARVEHYTEARFDCVMCRAFTSTREIIMKTRHLLAPQGVWLALKGPTEAETLSADATIACQAIPLQIPGLEAQRYLLRMVPWPTLLHSNHE